MFGIFDAKHVDADIDEIVKELVAVLRYAEPDVQTELFGVLYLRHVMLAKEHVPQRERNARGRARTPVVAKFDAVESLSRDCVEHGRFKFYNLFKEFGETVEIAQAVVVAQIGAADRGVDRVAAEPETCEPIAVAPDFRGGENTLETAMEVVFREAEGE